MSEPAALSGPLPTDCPLVWERLDRYTYALCHMTQTPRLDGFGKQGLEPLILYEYDPFSGQWDTCVLAPLPTAPPLTPPDLSLPLF